MLRQLKWISKWISRGTAIALALSLSIAAPAISALGAEGDSASANAASPSASANTTPANGTAAAAGSASAGGAAQPAGAAANNAAANNTAANNAAAVPEPVAAELNDLKEAVEAQTKQFDEHSRELDSERAALRDELAAIAKLEAKLGVAPDAATAGPATAGPATAGAATAGAAASGSVSAGAATSPLASSSTFASASAGAPIVGTGANLASNGAQRSQQQPINITTLENPLSLKIGGATFTPGGFVDLTGIFRSSDVGSGLSTNFTTLPYNNTLPLGQLSEFRFTGQGSRLSLRVDANPTQSTAVSGYVESDFNGFEPANSNISTKSDTFRLRLAFVQFRHNKWELVTGQTWSLLTPTRDGISPFPDNIFTALRLDSSYLAGLVFSRQPSIRLTYHATDWWAFAVALENPQQFVPSSVVFPTDGSTNFFSEQFDNGSSSTSAASSAVNPTVPNLHPDIEAKTSFDWRIGGKLLHVDADGVARSFRDYNNLVTPNSTNKVTGGGGGLNVNAEVIHNFHLIGNSFYGDGVGRYIGGLGPDVVVRPNGTLSAVRAGSGVGGFEWQTTPKLIIDSYYSGAYFYRNYALTTKSLGSACGVPATEYCVGFGYAGSANTNNKDYQEASIGFIPTIWSNPNYGRLQFISQFSYVVRAPWYVAPGSPKNAHDFLTYVDLRYTLP